MIHEELKAMFEQFAEKIEPKFLLIIMGEIYGRQKNSEELHIIFQQAADKVSQLERPSMSS